MRKTWIGGGGGWGVQYGYVSKFIRIYWHNLVFRPSYRHNLWLRMHHLSSKLCFISREDLQTLYTGVAFNDPKAKPHNSCNFGSTYTPFINGYPRFLTLSGIKNVPPLLQHIIFDILCTSLGNQFNTFSYVTELQ